jgi:membrane protein implicated in regulation of membrane protease activity
MTKRARILWFGLAAVLVVAGGVVAALVGGGSAGQVVGFVLVALGLMLATSLVFYEVGLSEDRELAREQEAREEAREAAGRARPREQGAVKGKSSEGGRRRVRLPRSRGRRRRIS